MPKFAVLNGNSVANVIMSDSQEIAEAATGHQCVDLTSNPEVGIGDTYDGSTFTVQPKPNLITEDLRSEHA